MLVTVAAAMFVFMLVVPVHVMIMLLCYQYLFLDYRPFVLRCYRDAQHGADRTAYHGSVTPANGVAYCRAHSAAERAA